MKKSLLIAVPLAGALMLSGCSTVFSGSTQQINITSTPSKQEVTLGNQTVTTPAVLLVDRSHEDLMLKSKDCNSQKAVASKINPVFFANILGIWIGGLGIVSSTTDASTGAMWKYDKQVHLECQK